LALEKGNYVEVVPSEREGAIIVKPYRRKWTTLRLDRKLTPEEVEEVVREAANEVASGH